MVGDPDRGVVKEVGRRFLDHVFFIGLLVKRGFMDLGVDLGSVSNGVGFLTHYFGFSGGVCFLLGDDLKFFLNLLFLICGFGLF